MSKGFGEDLWANLSEVRFDNKGVLRAPVRASADGIVVGRSAVRAADARHSPATPAPDAPTGVRAVVRRMLGRP